MAAPVAWNEPSHLDVDKLSYEIFSILESKFLFGYEDSASKSGAGSVADNAGKVRILSIDAAGDGLLAGAALVRLESSLRKQSGDGTAKIADFFDLAAGSGAGGVLAALLFTRGADGRPILSANEALRFLSKNRRKITGDEKPTGVVGGILRRGFPGGCNAGGVLRRSSGGGAMKAVRRVLGGASLRDAMKPILIPCYDLGSKGALVFSRADAVEGDGYDFSVAEVCGATCAEGKAVEIRSVDGGRRVRAVGGGVVMGNPTAMAITHVLNNGIEFPGARGVENLLVLSIGGDGEATANGKSASDLVKIVGGAQADMVDEAVALAFGDLRATNYVRVQGGTTVGTTAEEKLAERGLEAVLFRGRKLAERTNGEKLDWFACEAIKEQERRKRTTAPTVVIKPATTPLSRSSSSTFTTMASTITSGSF